MISFYAMVGIGTVATYKGQQCRIDLTVDSAYLVNREDAKVLAKLFDAGVMTVGKFPIGMMKLIGRFDVYEKA